MPWPVRVCLRPPPSRRFPRMRPVRASVALLLLVLAAADGAHAAQVASVFGDRIACVLRSEVQYCEGSVASRVESWDGVPLDVNVTLPPPDQTGPFPLVVHLDGWGGGQTGARPRAPPGWRARRPPTSCTHTRRAGSDSPAARPRRAPPIPP